MLNPSGPVKSPEGLERRAPLLAIDLSQRQSHLVLTPDGGATVFARTFEPNPAEVRETFWDALRDLEREAGIAPRDLGAIGVAVGPGGFTGLRISIAFAKAVALARRIPVAGLPSAEVFAASDAARSGRGPWLVALAAKDDSVWAARVGDGASPVSEPGNLVGLEGFGAQLAGLAARGGALLCDEHLPARFREAATGAGLGNAIRPIATDPAALARLAAERFARQAPDDAFALLPIYPREPEAVTKWRERRGSGG